MTHQEIIEANRLLAEFLGFWETEETYLYNPYFEKCYKYEDMLFSSSWDWIMKVVGEIHDLGYVVTIRSCGYTQIDGEHLPFIIEEDGGDPIESTFFSCIDFVKWYVEKT